MIPERKALRVCKVSLKIPSFGVNAIKEKRINSVDVMSLQMVGNPGCMASNKSPTRAQHTVQIPSMERLFSKVI